MQLKLLRFFLYCLLAVSLAEVIRYDALNSPLESRFSEESMTEIIQSILLVFASSTALYIYLAKGHYSMIALLFFCISACSFVREQDIYFEETFGKTTWLYPVILILVFVGYKLARNFQVLISELKKYTNSYPFGIFLSGFITTYIFSRLFGRKIFWYAVMNEQYIRAVKNAAEEGLELYGYLLLLFAIAELFFEYKAVQKNKESQQTMVIDHSF